VPPGPPPHRAGPNKSLQDRIGPPRWVGTPPRGLGGCSHPGGVASLPGGAGPPPGQLPPSPTGDRGQATKNPLNAIMRGAILSTALKNHLGELRATPGIPPWAGQAKTHKHTGCVESCLRLLKCRCGGGVDLAPSAGINGAPPAPLPAFPPGFLVSQDPLTPPY
jgi:hypothetical protein